MQIKNVRKGRFLPNCLDFSNGKKIRKDLKELSCYNFSRALQVVKYPNNQFKIAPNHCTQSPQDCTQSVIKYLRSLENKEIAPNQNIAPNRCTQSLFA